MAGFSGSTGVSQKQMTDAIAQSTANIGEAVSWTPVDTSLTLTNNSGQAIKIGNLVYLRCTFVVTQSIVNQGEITISGIPDGMSPMTEYQSLGQAACLTVGKSLYCRLRGGAIHIYNYTGAALDAGSTYIVNAVFNRT